MRRQPQPKCSSRAWPTITRARPRVLRSAMKTAHVAPTRKSTTAPPGQPARTRCGWSDRSARIPPLGDGNWHPIRVRDDELGDGRPRSPRSGGARRSVLRLHCHWRRLGRLHDCSASIRRSRLSRPADRSGWRRRQPAGTRPDPNNTAVARGHGLKRGRAPALDHKAAHDASCKEAAIELRRVTQSAASRSRAKQLSIAASASGLASLRKPRTSSSPSVAS